MSSHQMEETLLPKWLALPIFASDPLSSVAYATEAAMVVLVAASAAAAKDVFPISIAIAVLLAIVVASYRQTVMVYQSSGGAYIVSKENLGRIPSLVAAAALLIDYVLTVAVSVAAGVLALTSAVSVLRGHELLLSLACVVLISFANLRGVKEAGVLFALPTYAFVTSIFILARHRFRTMRLGNLPTRGRSSTDDRGCRSGHDLRPAAGLCIRVDRLDRRGGDRQRRQCLPPPSRPECGQDARNPGHDRDCDVRRRLVACRADACPADPDWHPFRPVRACARCFPGGIDRRVHVLGDPDLDSGRARASGQYVVPGVPAAGCASGPRSVLRAAVHEPRRPPRVLERNPRSRLGLPPRSSGPTTRMSTR